MAEFKGKSPAEMRKLAEAATPGPWAYEPHGDTGEYGVGVLVGHGDDDQPVNGRQEAGECIVVEAVGVEINGQPNAAYIAAANPAQITAMCDLIEAQARRIEELERGLVQARGDMEGWAAYADEHFRKKWNIDGDLAAIDALLTPGAS